MKQFYWLVSERLRLISSSMYDMFSCLTHFILNFIGYLWGKKYINYTSSYQSMELFVLGHVLALLTLYLTLPITNLLLPMSFWAVPWHVLSCWADRRSPAGSRYWTSVKISPQQSLIWLPVGKPLSALSCFGRQLTSWNFASGNIRKSEHGLYYTWNNRFQYWLF